MQVPWLLLHSSILFVVWWTLFLSQFPARTSHAVLVPLSMTILLGVVCSQVHAKQVLSRLQFHAVVDAAQQVHDHRMAAATLESAHVDSVHAAHEFILSYVSHHLRNPLHALNASLGMLRGCDAEALDIAQQCAAKMTMILDNVALFQQLQNGAVQSTAARTDMRHIIYQALHQASVPAPDVRVEVDDTVPASVCADAPHMTQLLSIGLSNALKFRQPNTEIVVACGMHEPGMLRVEVRNDGIGLDNLDKANVFNAFGANGGTEGLGLGLRLSKLIAGVLGGDVGLEDQGHQTVYWFTAKMLTNSPESISGLPGVSMTTHGTDSLSADTPWQFWGPHRSNVDPLRVLVVDDQRSNRLVLNSMLTQQGHTTTQREDGDQVRHSCSHNSTSVTFVAT